MIHAPVPLNDVQSVAMRQSLIVEPGFSLKPTESITSVSPFHFADRVAPPGRVQILRMFSPVHVDLAEIVAPLRVESSRSGFGPP